jgi:hypothetical protein
MIGRRWPASSSFVLTAARLRALQLDTTRAAAQTGSDEESHKAQPPPSPAITNTVTGPDQHSLLTKEGPMGAEMWS